jgi:hypothetical protein
MMGRRPTHSWMWIWKKIAIAIIIMMGIGAVILASIK